MEQIKSFHLLYCCDVQVALHVLSQAVPEELRPLPAHLVEVADNNTSALPNTGMDAGQLPSAVFSGGIQSVSDRGCAHLHLSILSTDEPPSWLALVGCVAC